MSIIKHNPLTEAEVDQWISEIEITGPKLTDKWHNIADVTRLLDTILELRKGATAFKDVQAERARQDARWGEQNHDDPTWALITGEEFGEVAQAILHTTFGGKAAGTTRAELVQLAAVCLQWIECIDRRTATEAQDVD